MNWRPANIAPNELGFETRGIVERFHEACGRLNVRPVTADINGGYAGRTAGGRVETADGRQLWLRVAGAASIDNRLLKADIAADKITGIPKPVLVERSDWVNGNVHWTARLITLADAAVEANPWAGPSAASVTDDWIRDLKQALDGLAGETSAQIHVSPEALQKWLSDTNQIEHEFPQSEWRLSHNDLNWSNLTAPKLSILDWEWHGLSPTGFDPGLLIAYSCRNEELVRRLERAFEPYFKTFTGRVARAFATDQLRSAAAGAGLIRQCFGISTRCLSGSIARSCWRITTRRSVRGKPFRLRIRALASMSRRDTAWMPPWMDTKSQPSFRFTTAP
ncbi:MAG: hypothetical protein U0987_16305, partial [Afipia sp.]|nr:hypothetical protein [Afipia sp.]